MADQAGRLRQVVQDRRKYLIGRLNHYNQTAIGKPFEDYTLSELETVHTNVLCQIGRELSRVEEEESCH